jgi:hypothetical protein
MADPFPQKMSLEDLLYHEGFSRLYFEGEDQNFGLELYVYEVGRLCLANHQVPQESYL